MRQLRLFLILTIAWLVFVFNLERPDDLLEIGNIDLASMVYILDALLVALILMMPELSRASIWAVLAPVLAIYGIIKYVSVQLLEHEFLGYVTLLEISILIITSIFARWLAAAILGFEQTVNVVLLGRVGERIMNAGEYEQAVNRELLRARQYKHDASLLHIRLAKSTPLLSQLLATPQTFQNRYLLARVVEAITELLNEYDLVGWHQGSLVIYLPETDRIQAARLVHQLYELLNRTFGLQTEIGIACFPKDALIYEDLVDKAQSLQIRSTQELNALVWDEQAS